MIFKRVFICLLLFFLQQGFADMRDDFFRALEQKDIKRMKILLDKGFDINTQNNQKQNPILLATYANDIELVQFLYDNGADVNARDRNLNSAFLYAGANGQLEILKIIYKKAKVNEVFNYYGGNALIPACERGHVETVKFLLESTNIDVNHINNLQWTALLEVVILGNDSANYVEITKLLLKHGANKYIKDSRGLRAIDYAKQKGFSNIVKLLE